MEKSKCRVCLQRHWGHEGHVWDTAEPEVSAVTAQEPSVVRPEVGIGDGKGVEASIATGQVARNRKWRQKNREAYNAYMREYMRKRRVHRDQ